MHDYNTTYIRYERNGDTVTPLRITKAWSKNDTGEAVFKIMRVSVVLWSSIAKVPELPYGACISHR